MPCQRCLERRRRLLEAAKARSLQAVAKEAAGGVVDMVRHRADGGVDYVNRYQNIHDPGARDGKPGT